MNFIKLTQYGGNNDIYVDSDKIQVITRVKHAFKEYGAVNEYTNIYMSAPVTPDVYFIHVNETPEEILEQINRYRDEFIGTLQSGACDGCDERKEDFDPSECYNDCHECDNRECGLWGIHL